jgi:nitroreductase/Pyruvate/2-oxoacid:ferredoxin oxidoreductase delta subunit
MEQSESLLLEIDQDRCTSCGICLYECPTGAVKKDSESGAIFFDEGRCIHCSHCGIVCPESAISTNRGSFPAWTDPKLPPEGLKKLLAGKRSVRRYRSDPVPEEVWEEILYVGSMTSTAKNAQDWHATILKGNVVADAAAGIMGYYRRIVEWALNPLVRPLLYLTPARSYLRSLKRYRSFINEFFGLGTPAASGPAAHAAPTEGRERSRQRPRDRLFFHAPGVVILSAPRKSRHLGMTDCVLAGQAMMYYAQSAGLGSCMIGYAEIALNRKKSLRQKLGIPQSHLVGLVFTLGYPDIRYRALPLRVPMPVTYHETLKS